MPFPRPDGGRQASIMRVAVLPASMAIDWASLSGVLCQHGHGCGAFPFCPRILHVHRTSCSHERELLVLEARSPHQ